MRRVIAPQAIRTMIPAFGNETVSALKNSSLASVISVQELTLRSTQLASSTFDFFSIFFASGLIYLLLTTGVSVIQLLVERALDLDRPATESRFARLLPWYRAPLAEAVPRPVATAPASEERRGRQGRQGVAGGSDQAPARLAHNEVVVDVNGLYKAYTTQPVSPAST